MMQKIHALHKHITYNSRAAGGLDQKVALYKKFVELEWFFWGGVNRMPTEAPLVRPQGSLTSLVKDN